MKLSVVIPAHNEEGCIRQTVEVLVTRLTTAEIAHEVLVVNDSSTDSTETILRELVEETPTVRYVNNEPPNGFGFAVRKGLAEYTGDAAAVFMADASDDPDDLVAFFRKLEEGYDCVFGTRWARKGSISNYPLLKRIINRMANRFVQVVMQVRYNDVTNAFKLYRREAIDGCRPLLSHHFNLTVELPLKCIVRGYRYAVLPNSWRGRVTGVSKLKIKEMGSRYLFIVLYCLMEKWLSRGDYHRDRRVGHGSAPGAS